MSRLIPNENTWIGLATAAPASPNGPTAAEIAAAVDVTCFTSSINASAQGNAIPTPQLCTLFETSIVGTSSATFSADFYRDDVADAAWDALYRGRKCWFYISRFGGGGAKNEPLAGQTVEVWPVQVTSRTAAPLASNTPQTFTVTCSVPTPPNEDGIVDPSTARVFTAVPDGTIVKKYTFTVTPSAHTDFDFGDGSPVVDSITGTAIHTYTTAGPYTAKATIGTTTPLTKAITVA